MKKVENYRPDEIEFTAESNEVPKFLSDETFESTEDAHKYINEHFIALHHHLNSQELGLWMIMK